MSNTEVTVVENQPKLKLGLNLVEYNNLNLSILNLDKSVLDLAKNFISIGFYLSKIKEDKNFTELGFADIYEFAKEKYGFGKTSTKNFINVFKKFGSGDSYPSLNSKYVGYNFSQLVELVPEKDNIDDFSPSQTIKEIRIQKFQKKLEGDFKKIKQWFETTLFTYLKEKYDACKLSNCYYDNSGYIHLCYKKNYKLTLYLVYTKTIVSIYSNDLNKYFSKEQIVSINLISKDIDSFIKKADAKAIEKAKLEEEKKLLELQKSQITDQEVELVPERAEVVPEELVEVVEPERKQLLKNNKEREEFIRDKKNFILLYDLHKISVRIYQCLQVPEIFEVQGYCRFNYNDQFEWKHLEWHLIEQWKDFGFTLFKHTSCSMNVLINHLRNIKY